MKRPHGQGWAAVAAYCAALFAVVIAVALYFGVPVPFAETLFITSMMDNVKLQGYLDVRSLLLEVREQQILFPMLMMHAAEAVLGLRMLSAGSIRFFTLLTPVFTACGLAIVAMLAGSTMSHRPARVRQIFVAAAATLMFSLSQWEAWSTITYAFTMCIALALGAVALLTYRRHTPPVVAAAALIAFVASFTFSCGLVTWIAVLPMLLFADPTLTHRRRCANLAFWLVCAIATFGLFLTHFLSASSPRGDGVDALFLPKFFRFYFTLLGSSFFGWLRPLTWPAFAAGVLTAFSFGWLVLRQKREHFARLLPWFCIACYSGITALLIDAGRGVFGIETALSSRFNILVCPLIIATLAMALIGPWGRRAKPVTAFFAVLLALQVGFAVQGLRSLYGRRVNLALAEACMRTHPIAPDTCLGRLFFSKGELGRHYAVAMHRLGSFDLFELPADASVETEQYTDAWTDSVTESGGLITATGWALKGGCAAWDVVFTAGPDRTLVAYTHPARARLDAFGGCAAFSGWYLQLDPERLPKEAFEYPVEVWVYDPGRRTLYKTGSPAFRLRPAELLRRK